MIDLIITIGAFVTALGILIAFHEFGHYWVARRVGVKVLRFSIGFGRPLYRRYFGADKTEFVIAAIPLGGYVKMLGEYDDEYSEDEAGRAFPNKPLWARMAVVAAGPVFNLVLAIIIFWGFYAVGINGLKPVVGEVRVDSAAAKAGFRPDDELLDIDGRRVQVWGQHRLYLFRRALAREHVVVRVRDADGLVHARTLDLSLIPVADIDQHLIARLGLIRVYPPFPPVVGELIPDYPAMAAGLRVGDRIVSVDGIKVADFDTLRSYVHKKPGTEVRIELMRGDERIIVQLVPRMRTLKDGAQIGLVGISPLEIEIPQALRAHRTHGPIEAFGVAVDQTWNMSVLTLEMLWRMLTLEVSSKNLSGPITIAHYAGKSAQIGLDGFVWFIAIISISLGVLNLLPIPVLDGGHLMVYCIEAVIRRPLSDAVMTWMQQIGMLLLFMLIALAIYNDLTRFLF